MLLDLKLYNTLNVIKMVISKSIVIRLMKYFNYFNSEENRTYSPIIVLSVALMIMPLLLVNISSLSQLQQQLLPSSYAWNNNNNNSSFVATDTSNDSGINQTHNFTALRTQYLEAWHNLNFSSSFNTFIVPNSDKGYGIYQTHDNNFAPGQDIVLYVEPVGFTHELFKDKNNTENTIYGANISVAVTISDKPGNQLAFFEVPLPLPYSYHENTEVYFTVAIKQHSPFPEQDYVAKYVFTDNNSGQSFTLIKDFRISKWIPA
jgi:hypothetical protein